eukprot:s642_g7.t4
MLVLSYPADLLFVNDCTMLRQFFNCGRCEASSGTALPALRAPRERKEVRRGAGSICLTNSDVLQHPPSCHAADSDKQRLCVCREELSAAPLKPAVRERAEATAEAAGWKPGLRRMALHAKGLQSFGTVAAAAKAHSIHVPMLLVAAGHSVAALNATSRTLRAARGFDPSQLQIFLACCGAQTRRQKSFPNGTLMTVPPPPASVRGATEALQVAFAIAALLSGTLLVAALSWDVWSKVLTSQEVDRHSLHAHFNLAEGCMRVRFYPDRAQPWKQVPEPLRVPWVPLAQLAEGPPGLAEFRRQLVRPGQRVDALGALPGERDLDFVVKNLDKSARSRDWDPTYFHQLDAVSALVHLCCCAALLLSFLALMAELIGASLHRRQLPAKRVGSVRVLRLAGALSMASAAAVAFALTQYSAVCRYRLKVLVSEFLLGITAGDVVVWPQDLTMVWGGGVYFALASGLLSFLSGVCLVFAELDSTTAETTSAAVGKVQTEVRRVEDRHFTSRGSAASIASEIETLEQEALEYVPEAVTTTEQQKEEELQFLTRALEATEAQLKAHNRKVAATVLLAMLAFVMLLCAVGFFMGRVAVAQGIQNALRGPQLTVKQTTLSFRKAKELAKDSVVGAGNATITVLSSAARHTWNAGRRANGDLCAMSSSAKSWAGSVASALKNPDRPHIPQCAHMTGVSEDADGDMYHRAPRAVAEDVKRLEADAVARFRRGLERSQVLDVEIDEKQPDHMPEPENEETGEHFDSPDWPVVLWNIIALPGRSAWRLLRHLGEVLATALHDLQHQAHRLMKSWRMWQLRSRSDTVEEAPAPRFRLPWQRPKPTELRKNELKEPWWRALKIGKKSQEDSTKKAGPEKDALAQIAIGIAFALSLVEPSRQLLQEAFPEAALAVQAQTKPVLRGRSKTLHDSARETQHLREVFTAALSTQNSSSLLVVHEGAQLSSDALGFFSQLGPLMDQDPSIWCIGAWNDAGLAPYVADLSVLLRTDWHPAKLAWMMRTQVLLQEILPSWPDAEWERFLRRNEGWFAALMPVLSFR